MHFNSNNISFLPATYAFWKSKVTGTTSLFCGAGWVEIESESDLPRLRVGWTVDPRGGNSLSEDKSLAGVLCRFVLMGTGDVGV